MDETSILLSDAATFGVKRATESTVPVSNTFAAGRLFGTIALLYTVHFYPPSFGCRKGRISARIDTARRSRGGGGKGTRMVDGAHFASRMANYVLGLKYATLKRYIPTSGTNCRIVTHCFLLPFDSLDRGERDFPFDYGALLIVMRRVVISPTRKSN